MTPNNFNLDYIPFISDFRFRIDLFQQLTEKVSNSKGYIDKIKSDVLKMFQSICSIGQLYQDCINPEDVNDDSVLEKLSHFYLIDNKIDENRLSITLLLLVATSVIAIDESFGFSNNERLEMGEAIDIIHDIFERYVETFNITEHENKGL